MLFLIAGSTGAGKTTVIKKVMQTLGQGNIATFPSCTTRPPREGEINGKDYCFLTKEQFNEAIKIHDIVEAKKIYGNYYGTNIKVILEGLTNSYTLIKDVDVEGYKNVIKRINYCLDKQNLASLPIVSILIDADDATLLSRMKGRNDNTNVTLREIELLKERAIKQHNHYDYRVINTDVDTCVQQVCDIINTEYLKNYGKPLVTTGKSQERI